MTVKWHIIEIVKKYFIIIFLMLMTGVWPVLAEVSQNTTSQTQIFLNEVLAGTKESASQEFIELANYGDSSIDLNGWKIQYASAGSTNWNSPTRTVNINLIIEAGGFLVVASNGYLPDLADTNFSSTLSQSGGNLRLINSEGFTVDQIAWGTGQLFVGQASAVAQPGQSLSRHSFSESLELANNADEFENTNQTTPGAENVFDSTQQTNDSPSTNENQSDETADPTVQNQELALESNDTQDQTNQAEEVQPGQQNSVVIDSYFPIEITEILPNPASPQTDADHEFVELFNSAPESVDLSGYEITTGLNDNYRYRLDGINMGPGQYIAIYSSVSTLTLSNSAGQASLYSPTGNLISQSAPYEGAEEGASWVLVSGQWQWSSTPTPASANLLTTLTTTSKTNSSSKKTTASKSKKSSSKTSSKKANTKSTGVQNQSEDQAEEAGQAQNIHPFVLAGVGVLALLYALYEYRFEVANYYSKLRANKKTGQFAGENNKTAGSY